MKRGFTLVELSIVLVIIGLLIGGILASQSMITTAKMARAIKQVSEYEIAINNFKSKYGTIPGDSNQIIDPNYWVVGDNDKTLSFQYESGIAWYQLSVGVGVKNKFGNNFVSFDPFNPLTEENCPRLNLKQDIRDYPCLHMVWGNNTLQFRYVTSPPSVAPTYDILMPAEALAIDTKVDDGKSGTGKVIAYAWATGGTTGYDKCADGDGVYNVANKTIFACTIYWWVGIFSGVDPMQ